jgi:hypothetical protein
MGANRYRKEQAKWEIVGATEHILNSIAPEWQPLVLKVKKIATDLGDSTRLLIRVLDWNRSTPPELIGTTVIYSLPLLPDSYYDDVAIFICV